MTGLVMMLLMAAAAPDPDRLPPDARRPPDVRDLPPAGAPPAIFTYEVAGDCRITGTRKLQGPDQVDWAEAQRRRQVFREDTVWRFIDGMRRQLRERRVKLRGEMVREGELVCHLLPSGEVAEAWIERRDAAPGRRRTPTREPVTVRDGTIADLGTYSLDLNTEETSR